MSDKTKKLSSAALDEKEVDSGEIVTDTVSVLPDVQRTSRSCCTDPRLGATPIEYPPNSADQIHGLSVAEMVRNGQGQVLEEDLSNYDYIDEKDKPFKDDGSLEVHSMQEVEWADPAEIFEKSQELESDIRNSITVKVDTDKLKNSVEDSKKSETSQKDSTDKIDSTK